MAVGDITSVRCYRSRDRLKKGCSHGGYDLPQRFATRNETSPRLLGAITSDRKYLPFCVTVVSNEAQRHDHAHTETWSGKDGRKFSSKHGKLAHVLYHAEEIQDPPGKARALWTSSSEKIGDEVTKPVKDVDRSLS